MDARSRTNAKILDRAGLLAARGAAREAGRSVVQCHGCFDIVHPGHVRHLQFAATQGDRLLVSITPDESVNKGEGRPLFSQDLRAENLAALDCVDWVCINDEPTAERLLETIRPDVYIKGREYERNDDPRFLAERSVIERHGGRVVFSSGDVVFSSTALVGAIGRGHAEDVGRSADPDTARLHQLGRMHDLSYSRLSSRIDSMRGERVAVVGEVVLDAYVHCDRPEVDSESPILSLRPIHRVTFDGGAAVVALHLASLGASPTLVTALPDSADAEAFRRRMDIAGIAVEAVETSSPMLEKQRFVVGRDKLMKLDCPGPIVSEATHREQLLGIARRVCGRTGGASRVAIVTDFGLGLLTPRTIGSLCDEIRPMVDFLSGDVSGRRSSLLAFRSADWLCPSELEMREALVDHESSLPALAWSILCKTNTRRLCATLGGDGLVAFDRLPGGGPDHGGIHRTLSGEPVPSLCPVPVDTLGCGDSLLAVSSLALACGASHCEAVFLGSAAASVQAGSLGNRAITRSELLDRLRVLTGGGVVVRRTPDNGSASRSASAISSDEMMPARESAGSRGMSPEHSSDRA